MPEFNVIRVHEAHAAKVRAFRTEHNIHNSNLGKVKPHVIIDKLSFEKWLQYIHQQSNKSDNLTSYQIKRIFDEKIVYITQSLR